MLQDEDEVVQKDGTLQVNDPVPKPLRELQQRKGPGRPLPPTPDDDDTMRRAASGSQLAAGIQRIDSSPGSLFVLHSLSSRCRLPQCRLFYRNDAN